MFQIRADRVPQAGTQVLTCRLQHYRIEFHDQRDVAETTQRFRHAFEDHKFMPIGGDLDHKRARLAIKE